MRKRLVPVRDRCDVILPFKKSSVSDADLLDRYADVPAERNRILDMPSVEAALRHGIVVVVRMVLGVMVRIIRVAEVRRAVLLLDRFSESVSEVGVMDKRPKMEGRRMTAMFSPKK